MPGYSFPVERNEKPNHESGTEETHHRDRYTFRIGKQNGFDRLHVHRAVSPPNQSVSPRASNPIQPRLVSRNIALSSLASLLGNQVPAMPGVLHQPSCSCRAVEDPSRIRGPDPSQSHNLTRAPGGNDGRVLLTALLIVLEWSSNTAFRAVHGSQRNAFLVLTESY